MKKLVLFAIMAMSLVVSCNKFDDSAIWDKLNNHETRIAYLEEVCKKMNGDIVNLQTIVTALESNDCVTGVTQLATGDGYAIAFKSGKSIVIYNGKDGQNGSNGKDAVTPVISVMKDDDGLYYWTVNGEWLIVDGQKVKASAVDGKNGSNGINGTNGTNGVDGVTPQFKIENDYWCISYDNGENWSKLGKAVGDNGLNGANGDNFFNGVNIYDGYVVFTLNDGNNTIIKLPLQKDGILEKTLDVPGTLKSIITIDEIRTTTKLKLKGNINNDDMKCIQSFISLSELDLSECTYMTNNTVYEFYLNPYKDSAINRTLTRVWLPQMETGEISYSHCFALTHVIVTMDEVSWSSKGLSFCPVLQTLEYAEGIKKINAEECIYYKESSKIYEYIVDSKYKNVILPSTVEEVCAEFLRYISIGLYTHYMQDYVVTCKATTPPVVLGINSISSSHKYYYENCTLFVPKESMQAYINHEAWGQFKVLPIAD